MKSSGDRDCEGHSNTIFLAMSFAMQIDYSHWMSLHASYLSITQQKANHIMEFPTSFSLEGVRALRIRSPGRDSIHIAGDFCR